MRVLRRWGRKVGEVAFRVLESISGPDDQGAYPPDVGPLFFGAGV